MPRQEYTMSNAAKMNDHSATMKRVKLAQLEPNRFRNFAQYPLNADRMAALEESMRATGLWEGQITAREADGEKYEIAFGHHRWQAAIRVFGDEYEVYITVAYLSDDDMLKRMARENKEEFGHSAEQDIELVRAALEGHVSGALHLPKNAGGQAYENVDPSDYVAIDKRRKILPLSREAICEYLGLPNIGRVATALAILKNIREGAITENAVRGLPYTAARDLNVEVNAIKEESGPEAAREFAEQTGEKIREKRKKKKPFAGTAKAEGKKRKQALVDASAETALPKALRGVRKKLKTAQTTATKAYKALRAFSDFLEQANVESMNAPEAYRFNMTLAGVRSEIDRYTRMFNLELPTIIRDEEIN
jgi:hypothetical protein